MPVCVSAFVPVPVDEVDAVPGTDAVLAAAEEEEELDDPCSLPTTNTEFASSLIQIAEYMHFGEIDSENRWISRFCAFSPSRRKRYTAPFTEHVARMRSSLDQHMAVILLAWSLIR